MTVSYYPSIATVRQGALIGLLLRWKGSLYKLVLPELILFLILYTLLSCIYRFALNEVQRVYFVNLCMYLDRYTNQSGLTFCLGFFVSIVMARWWETFKTLPWLYTPAYVFRQIIIGAETECYQVRLRLVRYLLLSWIFLTRKVSGQIMRRFKPGTKLLRDATLEEKLAILNEDPFIARFCDVLISDEEIDSIIRFAKKTDPDNYESYQPDYYVPLSWAADVVRNARKRQLLSSDFHERHVLQTLENFRAQLGMIGHMDQFNIPLVYTQVVCWSMHVYFIFSLFAEQFHGAVDDSQSTRNAIINAASTGSGSTVVGSDPNLIDLYIPFPSLFQLAFYFGWIKVAEVCLNPFGDDDDDFPMWNILNMNVETAFKMIKIPELNNTSFATEEKQATATSNGNSFVNNVFHGYNGHHGHPPMCRRVSATSQFEAFADQNAAERYRDEYERLARKYERPNFLGSAIESQMGREAGASTHLGLGQPSDYGGSRLILHEAGKALRKVSSVLRGVPPSSSPRRTSRTNLQEENNLVGSKGDRSVQIATPQDVQLAAVGIGSDERNNEVHGSPVSVRSLVVNRIVFGSAYPYGQVHESAEHLGIHETQDSAVRDNSPDPIPVPDKLQPQMQQEDSSGHLAIITEESASSPVGSCCSGESARHAEASLEISTREGKSRKIGTHAGCNPLMVFETEEQVELQHEWEDDFATDGSKPTC